jgi:16S rRNA processing protein RimM
MTKAKKNELPIGRIAGLFGIRGELKCDPTSAGRTLFSPREELRIELEEKSEYVRIDTVREHKGRLLITLEGVHDATAAERYVGATFYAERSRLDVGEGEYLDVDLIGCSVVGIDGKRYGAVERVEHYPASDMLVIGGNMLPMVKAFVRSIDIDAGTIVVDIPHGLLDEGAELA